MLCMALDFRKWQQSLPDNYFTSEGPKKPSIKNYELHKIRLSMDFEALTLCEKHGQVRVIVSATTAVTLTARCVVVAATAARTDGVCTTSDSH